MFDDVVHDLVSSCLQERETVSFHIRTSSMFPMLLPGDKLTVKSISDEELLPGAIIILRYQNSWIAHRLITSKQGPGGQVYITKGDNLTYPDEPRERETIQGAVCEIVRGDRRITLTGPVKKTVNGWIGRLSLLQVRIHSLKYTLIRRLSLVLVRLALFAIILLVYGR